jgi:LCP family protein required for cell wall assembly
VKVSREIEETKVYQRSEVGSRRKRSWVRIAGISFLGLALFTIGVVYGLLRWSSRPSDNLIPVDYEEQDRVNILVLGVDGGVNGNGQIGKTYNADIARSDVMILVSLDLKSKDVGVLSIPRDTRAYISSRGTHEKIAHAHAYGGPELAKKTVENLLDVPVHHWVRVDFEAFKKAVDALGGVYIDVPRDMDYKDPYQDLYIHIKKGPQTLYGDEALKFVRYREYVDGDIGRIGAQELFLKALIEKAASLSTVLKIPELVSELAPYFKTDLATQDLLYLATQCVKLKPEDIKMDMIPGVPQDLVENGYKVSYWMPDMVKAKAMIDELILGLNPTRLGDICLSVQNGMGLQGAADALSSILRSIGFSVVSVGNADRMDYETTQVLAGPENRDAQLETVKAIKTYCPNVQAYESHDMPEGVDVLIIMGKDYVRTGTGT